MTTDRMTAAEAVILCRFAKACCPQQAFDAYTPDAWFELLRDLRFEDCKIALTRVVKSKPFVSPAEIRDEVGRVRADRLAEFDRHYRIDPPQHLADDPTSEIEWRRELRARIADGEVTDLTGIEDAGQTYTRDLAELGQIGQRVPRA